jgi:hypothetical protein
VSSRAATSSFGILSTRTLLESTGIRSSFFRSP